MAVRVPGSAMATRSSPIHHGRPNPRIRHCHREAPDPLWPPEAPDPPWPPEPQNPPRRLPQCPCPASASRALTLPPRCFCYGAGRAIREGEVMLRFVCLSSITPIIIIITRPHLSSPEPQSSTPAPHLILITSRYLSTLLSSVDRRISLIEHWTLAPDHLPFSSVIIINKTYSPSLLVSQSHSMTP